MKTFKRITSLVLALAMMLTMSAFVFAADGDGDIKDDGIAGNTDGVWTAQDTPVAQTEKTVTLHKEITFYNPEATKVYGPSITYTYTVEAGEAGKDIWDNEANHSTGASAHVTTKEGVVAGVKVNNATNVGTLVFTPGDQEYDASPNGSKVTKDIKIDFGSVAFTGAGVYRYKITETANKYNSNGVIQGNSPKVRYLDVYVKDHVETDGTVNGYDIYGFVCFKNNNSIDGRGTPATTTPADAEKTEGFVSGPTDPNGDGNHDDDVKADEYYTYNLTLKKTLVGDQAMNNNKFPFSLDFDNTAVTEPVLLKISGTGTEDHPTNITSAGDLSTIFDEAGTTTRVKIANGGTVTYAGIPVGTTVTVNEYNNVTGTIYTTTATGGSTETTVGIALNPNTWTNDAAYDGKWTAITAVAKTANTVNEKAEQNFTITFTNTLLNISPTGYVARIAPYAAILGTGIVLLVVARKFKKDDEEELEGEAVRA